MRSAELLIVGGGPAGLSLAYHYGRNSLVLEKEQKVGGLCRSIQHDGGIFDIGGHVFHTPHPEVASLVQRLMGDRWFSQKRDARVYTHGTLIPYPFQKFYDRIPEIRTVEECRRGLQNARLTGQADNFEEYILDRFGEGVASHFMLPYNRKLWARDLRRMSCEWTAERVAGPKGIIEKFDNRGGTRKPLQPDTIVGYPAEGGYEEIYKSFVPHLPALELGQRVIRIKPFERVATTDSGLVVQWRRLASTMPLPVLVRIVEGLPSDVVALADRLEFTSMHLLLLLVGRPLPNAPQRIYVADPDIPPHKIAFNHTSSDSLRARPVHAIMAEISYSDEKPLPEADTLQHDTTQFLIRAGVLDSVEDVLWTGHLDVTYAYPVYTHDRCAIVRQIRDFLEPLGIYTLGRFGEWDYANSDQCIKRGMELAAELRAHGTSKRTDDERIVLSRDKAALPQAGS
jgi:Protoporphyrinogen oxidase